MRSYHGWSPNDFFVEIQPNLIFSFSKLILLNDTYKYVVVVPSLTIKIVKRFAYARQLRCRAIGKHMDVCCEYFENNFIPSICINPVFCINEMV